MYRVIGAPGDPLKFPHLVAALACAHQHRHFYASGNPRTEKLDMVIVNPEGNRIQSEEIDHLWSIYHP